MRLTTCIEHGFEADCLMSSCLSMCVLLSDHKSALAMIYPMLNTIILGPGALPCRYTKTTLICWEMRSAQNLMACLQMCLQNHDCCKCDWRDARDYRCRTTKPEQAAEEMHSCSTRLECSPTYLLAQEKEEAKVKTKTSK